MSSDPNDDGSSAFEKTNIYTSQTAKIALPADQVPSCLVLIAGPVEHIGHQWRLDKPRQILGRLPTAEVHIPDISVSKQHAQIDVLDKRVFITDLGSTNGTFVDDKRLIEKHAHPLKHNSQIRTGGLVFKFFERGIVSETEEKSRMQSELESARTVQETLLPVNKSATYQWLELSGYYRSATECGGDWWWHWTCGHRAFAFIGDVTGHGAAAAMITSAARSAIGTLEDNPAARVEDVYMILTRALFKSSKGQLTMSGYIVEVDLETRVARMINASHLPAIILPKPAVGLTWKDLKSLEIPPSQILGSPEEKAPQIGKLTLPQNARLVLLTDGLTERLNTAGQQLTERAFNKMLIDCHTKHEAAQTEFLKALIESSDQTANSAPLADDITVVVLDLN